MRERVDNIQLVTRMLALYFVCVAFDSFAIGTIGSIAKMVAVLPMLCAVLDYRKLIVRIDKYFVILLLFWLITVMSLFYTLDLKVTIQYVETLTLNVGMMILLGGMETYSEKEKEYLIKALVLGGWVTVILTLIFADYSALGRLTIRMGSAVQDQNGLTGYFMITFVWHLCQFFVEKKKIHIVPSALLFTIAVFTGSRGGVLAYIAMLVCVCFHSWIKEGTFAKRIRTAVALIIVVIVIYGFVQMIVPEEVTERFTFAYFQQKGTTGRTKTWGALWNHFMQDSIWRQLFGHGYGTTKLVNTYKNYVAHNLYLDNLISIGMIGMTIHLTMQLTFLREAIRQDAVVFWGTFIGYTALCCSLSLVSYKPIWNLMIIILITHYRKSEND